MAALQKLLANPAALVALLCLGGLVLGSFLSLAALLRGRPPGEAEVWHKIIAGGQPARQRRDEALDELHRRVSDLRPPDEPPPPA